jgi:phage terminase large subunit-like protein
VRAEPISHLYDKGDIRHVGSFHELEDQMCNFTSLGYMGDRSPDRADALIWALTDLFPGLTKKVRKKGNGGVTLEGINTFDPLRG